MMRRSIIIDTDPGIDDVVAISAALFAEELDVRLITTVAGNVGIDRTTQNALDLVNFFNKYVPVAAGATEPMVNDPHTAKAVHGESGVGTFEFPEKVGADRLVKEHAIVAMRNEIMDAEEPMTLVAIGPLTNIALLFKVFPETKPFVREIVLMGGAVEGGNATPVAEFNIYADPHAAKVVFESGLPVVMCGLDATRKTSVPWDDIVWLKENTGKAGHMVYTMMEQYIHAYSKKGIAIHDLCTILYLTSPNIFSAEQAEVRVVTEGEAAGCTVTYFQEAGPVSVCVDADKDAFRSAFASIFQNIDMLEG